jgi:ABC-type lipoprotein release transport system permease subunit
MLTLKLAFRNLVGTGKRTWLNITVLSIVYVMIIIVVSYLSARIISNLNPTQV